MVSEWEVAAKLITPQGELLFNQEYETGSDRRFVLNPRRCDSSLGVRVTEDDIPQADGAIPHRRFRSGYRLHLAFELVGNWNGGDVEPAVGSDLVEMEDLVGLHVNSTIRTGQIPGGPNASYVWSPTGAADRMFDHIQLFGEPTLGFDGDLGCSIYEVDLSSSDPYCISAAETSTSMVTGDTTTITNDGNTDYFVVVRAYGPYTGFTLRNDTVVDFDGNPLKLVYDSTLPGAEAVDAGDWITFIFFLQTAYLNDSGSNRKGGIDMEVSDFWPLVPGDNEIHATFTGGAGGTHFAIASHDAWA